MTAAAQLLDAIVPLVRTRLPAGVDVAYLVTSWVETASRLRR